MVNKINNKSGEYTNEENLMDVMNVAKNSKNFAEFRKVISKKLDEQIENNLNKQSYEKQALLKRTEDTIQDEKSILKSGSKIIGISQVYSIGKQTLENSLALNAVKSRSIERQARTKKNITGFNDLLGLGIAFKANPLIGALALTAQGISAYYEIQERNFKIEQENISKDLQRQTLGHIANKGGR